MPAPKKEVVRAKVFTVRLSPAEWKDVERMAKHYAIPIASLFRMLMADRARELWPAKKK